MTALSNSVVIPRSPAICLSSSGSLKSTDHSVGPTNLAFSCKGIRRSSAQRRVLTIKASYSNGGRPSSASIFISKALTGTERRELMKKLPKFIYDDEKAVEKQRQKLADKIEELNLAIDNISNRVRSEEPPNGAAVGSDDIEALA